MSRPEGGYLTFGVGFKFDDDALAFHKEGGYIKAGSGQKLYAKITPAFECCLPMIK